MKTIMLAALVGALMPALAPFPGVERPTPGGYESRKSLPANLPETSSPPPSTDEPIGSERNARVARPMPPDPAERTTIVLTYLAGPLADEQLDEAARAAPNIRVIRNLDRQTALDHAAEADGVDGRLVTAEFLERAARLSWIHSPSAGVERIVSMRGLAERPSIVLTNSRGVHGPAIADHAMAMLLSLTRRLPHYAQAQSKGLWTGREPSERAITLSGRTMLVVGLGGIGSEVARRAHGFGMRLIATRRSQSPSPPFVDRVGSPDDLPSMIGEADVVVICVPLTKETLGLFNAAMIARMKPGAYLINMARGRIVDTGALIEALRSGRLAGAGLDVTDPEPLPEGHPLWSAPNVVITPHISADGELTDQRWWALYAENMRRFGAGEPLLNVVDVAAEY